MSAMVKSAWERAAPRGTMLAITTAPAITRDQAYGAAGAAVNNAIKSMGTPKANPF